MRATLLIAAVVAASAAQAETALPVVDVDALCAKMAPNAQWCVNDEQDHYDALKFYWPSLSERGRATCLGAVGAPRPRYFYLLDGCVLQVLNAERISNPERRRFQP